MRKYVLLMALGLLIAYVATVSCRKDVETRPSSLEGAALSSVTVVYGVVIEDDRADLSRYSGIVLDATHVLIPIIRELPSVAYETPRIVLPTMMDGRADYVLIDTLSAHEVRLPEIDMMVVTTEKPLPNAAALARKFEVPLGEEIFVLGTYAHNERFVTRGSVAKICVDMTYEDSFAVDASLVASSRGAGVYDGRHALVGIVTGPRAGYMFGSYTADTGWAIKIEAVAKALREHGIAFTLEP